MMCRQHESKVLCFESHWPCHKHSLTEAVPCFAVLYNEHKQPPCASYADVQGLGPGQPLPNTGDPKSGHSLVRVSPQYISLSNFCTQVSVRDFGKCSRPSEDGLRRSLKILMKDAEVQQSRRGKKAGVSQWKNFIKVCFITGNTIHWARLKQDMKMQKSVT